jgi:MraZ protein
MGRTIQLFDRAAYDEQMNRDIPADEVVDFFG